MHSGESGALATRLLIVDDEPIILELMRAVLTDLGHGVDVASSGEEALETIQRGEPIDALICDVGLPGMDGISLQRELAQREHPLAQRMMVMTGDMGEERVRRFIDQTGLRALQKPFDLHLVQEWLGELGEVRTISG